MIVAVDRFARLAVRETLVTAWREACAASIVYARLAWLPFATFLIGRSIEAYVDPQLVFDPYPQVEGESGLRSLAFGALHLVMILTIVPAFAAWHRFLVLGPKRPTARLYYSIGDEEWSYLNVALRLGAIWVVLTLFGATLAAELVEHKQVIDVVVILAWLPIARWLLLFPAAAVGRQVEGRWRAWSVPDNAVRLWLVVAIPEAAVTVVDGALSAWLGDLGAQTSSALIYAVVGTALDFAGGAISVAALSVAYRRLALPSLSEAEPGEA